MSTTAPDVTIFVFFQGGAFPFDDLAEAHTTIDLMVGGTSEIVTDPDGRLLVSGPRGSASISVVARPATPINPLAGLAGCARATAA